MSSIVNTALAAVQTNGQDSYLYYQSGQEIREAHSASGTSWTANASTVASNAASTGSAMTAYYVDRDADFGNRSTIHVVYLDTNAKVVDRVKILANNTWEDGQTTGISKDPVATSMITGGAFNGTTGWAPNGSQWNYYNTPSGNELQITEIRRTPRSPWNIETVLPENTQALPGTDLACSIVSGTIDLYYQDHAGNVNHWESRNSQWIDDKVLIPTSDVQISTPLATVNAGKKHVFYVDRSSPPMIKDLMDGDTMDVASFYPGTRLSALSSNGQVTLFYKLLNPVGAIASRVFDGSTWRDGPIVVPA
ncbi:hypothetical protein BDV25DRAFT_167773 [Aspergillus avenaceus]|uniref:Fucose-specific lectin n=1 Tax=Aspergillus avenaceus TaxID=36643 RepID=A0A5N6U661_ASPAV|nr:hypothetical protein BDV25DRAFT_167773 [Aspergillus avenaceus]